MESVYLNHAGTSWPKPSLVREAVAAQMDSDPVRWGEGFARAHETISAFFHIPRPKDLLLTPGCTSALEVGVRDHWWQPGDRVITSSMEHHALYRPLQSLTAYGVELEVVPRDPSGGPLDLEVLEARLQRGSTKMVAMTAASNVTGEIFPYQDIIDLSHRYGALIFLDLAQIAGWVDLDLPTLGVDLAAFAGHKALNGPWGIGGLYIKPGLSMHTPEAHCEVGGGGCEVRPSYCDTGSVDRLALRGLAEACGWLNEPLQKGRLARGQALARSLRDELAKIKGTQIYGSDHGGDCLPTVAFTCEDGEPSECARKFEEMGVVVSGGIQCAPLAHKTLGTGERGVIRVSFGVNSCEQDLERLVEVLR